MPRRRNTCTVVKCVPWPCSIPGQLPRRHHARRHKIPGRSREVGHQGAARVLSRGNFREKEEEKDIVALVLVMYMDNVNVIRNWLCMETHLRERPKKHILLGFECCCYSEAGKEIKVSVCASYDWVHCKNTREHVCNGFPNLSTPDTTNERRKLFFNSRPYKCCQETNFSVVHLLSWPWKLSKNATLFFHHKKELLLYFLLPSHKMYHCWTNWDEHCPSKNVGL